MEKKGSVFEAIHLNQHKQVQYNRATVSSALLIITNSFQPICRGFEFIVSKQNLSDLERAKASFHLVNAEQVAGVVDFSKAARVKDAPEVTRP